MSKNVKNIIIIVIIVLVLGSGYVFFFGNSNDDTGSDLVSSSGVTAASVTQQINEDTAFLSTLLGLGSIKIDPGIFRSATFSALVDNTVPIVNTGGVGRTNPFYPFEEAPSDTSTSFPTVVNITSTASDVKTP